VSAGKSFRIETEYSIDFNNHPLGRKQAGFTGESGYLVMEAGWYPWLTTEIIPIPAQITVKAPSRWKVFAPGTIGKTKNIPPYTITTFTNNMPTWPFLVYSDYSIHSFELSNRQIEICLLPRSDADIQGVKKLLSDVWISLGEILPEPALDTQRIVETGRYGGYGPVGALLIGPGYLDGSSANIKEKVELISHELSHSWVQSIAQPAGKYAHFLSEGLATYVAGYTVGRLLGEEESERIWRSYMNEYASIEKRVIAPSEVTPDMMFTDNGVYRGVVYFKGAWLFKHLENKLSVSGLKVVLDELLSKNKDGSFTMDDLYMALTANSFESCIPGIKKFLESTELSDCF
jgi:hypothetical protein